MNIDNLKIRSQVIKAIRTWFDNRGFLEMHTPRLVGLPGQEPYLDPFWTLVSREPASNALAGMLPSSHHQAVVSRVESKVASRDLLLKAALITSPEYSMKKLLGAGMDKIYDLGPCFRNNEPWDGSHDPEFLMLEWYTRNTGVQDLMEQTEEMIRFVVSRIPNTKYQIPNSPFRRLTVEDAWRQYAGVELDDLLDNRADMAVLAAKKFNQTVTDDDTWDDLYFKIFLSEIEPKIEAEEPTFLYRYPASMAALARKSADDPRWAERVEFYMGGLELANGFAELSDPIEQRKRFLEEQQLRKKLGKDVWAIDEEFLKALPGMDNAAGIAFGVDRLVMLLCGTQSINDVIPFSARERFR